MSIKHWAVMNDTGEVIAQGASFSERQHRAFMTGRWRDKNTGEFMPAGTSAPYHITNIEPSCAAALRKALIEAEAEITERTR